MVVVGERRQVISGEAVRLQDDEVVHQPVLEGDLAPDQVVQRRSALQGHLEPDDRHRSLAFSRPTLPAAQVAAPAVVARGLLESRLLGPHIRQPVGRAVAEVGLVPLQKLVGGGGVKFQALGLIVWPEVTTDARPLVPVEPEPP